MTGDVGVVTVIATEEGATIVDSPIAVSVTAAVTVYVGLLGVEYACVNDRVAAPLLLAVVVLGGEVVPSPQATVPLKEFPAGAAQFRFAVTVAPVPAVVGLTESVQASPTATLIGGLVTAAAIVTVVSVAAAVTGKVGLLAVE